MKFAIGLYIFVCFDQCRERNPCMVSHTLSPIAFPSEHIMIVQHYGFFNMPPSTAVGCPDFLVPLCMLTIVVFMRKWYTLVRLSDPMANLCINLRRSRDCICVSVVTVWRRSTVWVF